METNNKTIDDVIKKMKINRKKTNVALIQKAYKFAEEHHRGQKRLSGEDYIIHPLNVAYILADLQLDDATICAALLHDVVEDTDVTNEDIIKNFGRNCRNGSRCYKTRQNTICNNRRRTSRKLQKNVPRNGKRYKSYINKISR